MQLPWGYVCPLHIIRAVLCPYPLLAPLNRHKLLNPPPPSFPNGDRYQGAYQEDLPHGYGVYLFSSGQTYEGEWAQGKKHGWSIYTVDNGEGRWTQERGG